MTGNQSTTGGKIPAIKWEDDDDDFGAKKEADEESQPEGDFESDSFEKMVEKAEESLKGVRLMVGEKIKGRIATIPTLENDVLVDIGMNKMSGVIDRQELLDEAGQLKFKVGDQLDCYVLARKGSEVQLSFKNTPSLKSMADLEAAYDRKQPVKGRVTKVIKGGFEITILGKQAFCPVSQIDSRFVEKPEDYVGQELDFLIEKLEEKGRNIVVGRSTLLKQKAEQRLKELVDGLKPDTVLDGTVKELRDFGAFVDIGGVDGMVHVSEIAYARISKPGDVLTVGDKVRVKVLKVEQLQTGKAKISLSMKAAQQDPWEDIGAHVEGGATYTGRVVSLQAFGAFIELKPGVEGLLHVSEMSWLKRVHHPSELVKVGDTVTVTIKDIDRLHKRISLTMKAIEDDPWFGVADKFPVGKTLMAPVERLKPFGAIITLQPGLSGMLPISVIKKKFGEAYRTHVAPPKELEVKILEVDKRERKVKLGLAGVEQDEDGTADYQEYLKAEREAKDAKAKEEATPSPSSSNAPKAGSLGALLAAKMQEKSGKR